MRDRDILCSLDRERFQNILGDKNWFKLQLEFKTKKVLLSQSLLIWNEELRNTWLLADFENQETYHIRNEQDTEGNSVMLVSELSDEDGQPLTAKDPKVICSYLKRDPRTGREPQGTHIGFIDLLQKLNLDEVDLEGLKRSSLSGSGLSFESIHPDLLIVHNMLREILTSTREDLISLSHAEVESVRSRLPQFYEKIQKIMEFDINVENPSETHANLLKEISDFCSTSRNSLNQIITYLRSKKVEQLEDRVKTTLTDAGEKFNTETEKLQKFGEEVKEKEQERQENFDQLKVQLQNQLTEKPISQYKEIFAEQAEKYRNGSRFWLGMAGLATVVFGGTFILLSIFLQSGGTGLTGILQNLFTKGFVLSPIYVWLNRSIKNHTAQKHLEIINVHRQNALETFDTFVAAAEGNRETRDAVLLAATKAIFDANQSGYLSTKTSGSDNTSPVQQIIKEVLPTKSSDN